MPIIQNRVRKNPLDLNKNIKIGIAFPLNQDNFFKGTETVQEQTKTNLINLLLTDPGERLNLPFYGVGIKHLLFEQNLDKDLLQTKITEQVLKYIPSIRIIYVRSSSSQDQHTLYLGIIYKSLTDNSTDSIQLNFN